MLVCAFSCDSTILTMVYTNKYQIFIVIKGALPYSCSCREVHATKAFNVNPENLTSPSKGLLGSYRV